MVGFCFIFLTPVSLNIWFERTPIPRRTSGFHCGCGSDKPHVLQAHLFHRYPKIAVIVRHRHPGIKVELGSFLHGRLVYHQVAVGGAAVFVDGVTPVLVGLGSKRGRDFEM